MDEVVKSCQLVTSLSLSVLCHKYAAVYECAAVNDCMGCCHLEDSKLLARLQGLASAAKNAPAL
jgi:hypothetical protein